MNAFSVYHNTAIYMYTIIRRINSLMVRVPLLVWVLVGLSKPLVESLDSTTDPVQSWLAVQPRPTLTEFLTDFRARGPKTSLLLAFLHVPKTAGQSFFQVLLQALGNCTDCIKRFDPNFASDGKHVAIVQKPWYEHHACCAQVAQTRIYAGA